MLGHVCRPCARLGPKAALVLRLTAWSFRTARTAFTSPKFEIEPPLRPSTGVAWISTKPAGQHLRARKAKRYSLVRRPLRGALPVLFLRWSGNALLQSWTQSLAGTALLILKRVAAAIASEENEASHRPTVQEKVLWDSNTIGNSTGLQFLPLGTSTNHVSRLRYLLQICSSRSH